MWCHGSATDSVTIIGDTANVGTFSANTVFGDDASDTVTIAVDITVSSGVTVIYAIPPNGAATLGDEATDAITSTGGLVAHTVLGATGLSGDVIKVTGFTKFGQHFYRGWRHCFQWRSGSW